MARGLGFTACPLPLRLWATDAVGDGAYLQRGATETQASAGRIAGSGAS